MGFTEVLTVIFVVLKVFNIIDWSWWLVFLPELIAGVLYTAIFVFQLFTLNKCRKEHDKIMKDMWD